MLSFNGTVKKSAWSFVLLGLWGCAVPQSTRSHHRPIVEKPNLSLPTLFSRDRGFELLMTVREPAVFQYVGRQGDTLLIRFPRGRLQKPKEERFSRGPVRSFSLTQNRFSADLEIALQKGVGKESVSYEPMSHELRVWIPGSGASSETPLPERRVVSRSIPRVFNPAAGKKGRPIQKIMVDPGHGGRDVGALGRTGLLEKDVNLMLARALASRLKLNGYQVALTRTSDVFIPLAERSAMANQWGADLFVSVHCNASLSHRLRGFEVYFLSEKASDAEAEAVARTENSVMILERDGKLDSKVKQLLLSMAQNEYLNEASRICAYVARKVGQEVHGEQPRVRQADFYVLREAGMPAILVEFDYLSNPISEARLRSQRFRSKLATAVSRGIASYEALLKPGSRRVRL